MKFLFVSKDMGSANSLIPVALELKNRGHEIVACTEHLAQEKFAKAGFINTEIDLDKNSEKLKEFDFVVCGESAPINLEEKFGLAANREKIPLVFIEDYWGGFTRSKAKPDLILTLDEYAKKIALVTYPEVQVEIVGNVGVPSLEKIADLKKFSHPVLSDLKQRGVKIIAYIGGGPTNTLPEMQLLVAALKETKGDWVLVPRFHPKWAALHEEWKKYLGVLGDKVLLDTFDGATTEQIAVQSDLVAAGMSTLLTTAVVLDVSAVALDTPESKLVVKGESGLDAVPQVEMGWVYSVSEPQDLSTYFNNLKAQDSKPEPLNAKYAGDCIEKMFIDKV